MLRACCSPRFDRTIENALGTSRVPRKSTLDVSRCLVAMIIGKGVRLLLRPDPDASLSKLIFDLGPLSHGARLRSLSKEVNRRYRGR
jgi:hypothetical protein